MSEDVPAICLKRRGFFARLLFGKREDLEAACEEEDGYCAHCHSRIAGGGPF